MPIKSLAYMTVLVVRPRCLGPWNFFSNLQAVNAVMSVNEGPSSNSKLYVCAYWKELSLVLSE
jgi:hypothetical protein